MASSTLRADLQKALHIVWLILAGLCGLAVMLPVVFPAEVLAPQFPVCAAKAAGGSCILCGMTTAFLKIGEGDLAGASVAHGGSIFLYTAMALNFGIAVAYTMLRVFRHANT